MSDKETVLDLVDDLIEAITDTEEYINYRKTLNSLKQWPELKEKIDEFRAENFILQTDMDERHLPDAVEDFERRYEGFRADSRVNDFLVSELAFNRLMQDVYNEIMSGIEYE